MTAEDIARLITYDELGAHRHLVISERLRVRRRDLGLTQKEVVARLRRMGIASTNKALSSLEHGAGLDVCKLPEIARALQCSLTYLVGLTEDPSSWEPDAQHWPERTVHAPVRTALPTPMPTPTRTATPTRPATPTRTSTPMPAVPRILGPIG